MRPAVDPTCRVTSPIRSLRRQGQTNFLRSGVSARKPALLGLVGNSGQGVVTAAASTPALEADLMEDPAIRCAEELRDTPIQSVRSGATGEL